MRYPKCLGSGGSMVAELKYGGSVLEQIKKGNPGTHIVVYQGSPCGGGEAGLPAAARGEVAIILPTHDLDK